MGVKNVVSVYPEDRIAFSLLVDSQEAVKIENPYSWAFFLIQ